MRAYPARLADTLLTPAERAEGAEQALAALQGWNGGGRAMGLSDLAVNDIEHLDLDY
ncbi:hypothetical protein ABZY02_17480 [Streptomyces sp. NPDC006649]|uniref:hypothetical protein n=1 Tax=Streptomyces sp. NPDC006649 TaxID=3156896 RepID=UPI0033A861AE